MADICVIYASNDREIVRKLVTLLRRYWHVWWDEDISSGNWEQAVLDAISQAKAVVPVVSPNSEKSNIFSDELAFAVENEKKIFPFLIDQARLPLGFSRFNRTDAFGWSGEEQRKGFRTLIIKIKSELAQKQVNRIDSLTLGTKTIRLPSFVFSVSSHETQLDPRAGVELLEMLAPPACLVSAYDVYNWMEKKNYPAAIGDIIRSPCTLFLDSGNYEASRKRDYYIRTTNENGWSRDKYLETVKRVLPDIVFAYDHPNPKGKSKDIVEEIIKNTKGDEESLANEGTPVCPIVHLPPNSKIPISELASEMVEKVAAYLDPVMIAIPERELGSGIVERAKTVREIRRSLDSLGKYVPLHLLGTGNPISILILSAAGGDSFDGLEWCRTAADWDTWRLFHFQQFDFFCDDKLGRLRSKVRSIVGATDAPYSVKVACYNLETFLDWTREIQGGIGTSQIGELMKLHIPGIGDRLCKELL